MILALKFRNNTIEFCVILIDLPNSCIRLMHFDNEIRLRTIIPARAGINIGNSRRQSVQINFGSNPLSDRRMLSNTAGQFDENSFRIDL